MLLHHPLQRLPPPTPGRGSRNGKVLPRKSKTLPRRCQPLGCEQMVGRRRQRSYPAARARSDVLSSARTSLHNCSLDEEKPFDSNDESIFCLPKGNTQPLSTCRFRKLRSFPKFHLCSPQSPPPPACTQGCPCPLFSRSPLQTVCPPLIQSNNGNVTIYPFFSAEKQLIKLCLGKQING